MANFIVDFWNDFDVNLRKGYATFFVLAMTAMPFAKYLSDINLACISSFCSAQDYMFMKNLIVAFSLYIFVMIILIMGHVMKYLMVGYQKPEVKTATVKEIKKEANLDEYKEKINRFW